MDLDAVLGGALREVDALGVGCDAAANDMNTSRLKLRKDSVLVGDAGAHRVDHVHAADDVLSVRGLRRQRGNHGQSASHNRKTKSIEAGHLFLPDLLDVAGRPTHERIGPASGNPMLLVLARSIPITPQPTRLLVSHLSNRVVEG